MDVLNAFVAWVTSISLEALVIAAIGSLAGAWGGAYAIQRIANSAKRREGLLDEVRRCNEVLELLHGVCNTLLNAKEQYIEDLHTRYRLQRLLVFWHHARLQRGEVAPGTVVDVGQIDLQVLNLPPVRVERIESILFEKLSITGRARTLIGVLYGAVQELYDLLASRNAWLDEHRRARPTANQRVAAIFGLPDPAGHIDATYGTLVEGIYRHVDDCVMFAVMLAEDVRKHGLAMRKRYVEEFGRDIVRISRLDFSDVHDKGLMPHRPNYASWDRTHIAMVPMSRGLRLAQLRYWIRVRYRRSRKWVRRLSGRVNRWLCKLVRSKASP